MLRKGFLMLCLLVGSLILTTTVHARENPNMVTLECSGVVHSDAGEKTSPQDAEKGAMHHHGCHGASTFLPGHFKAAHSFAIPSNRYPVDRLALHVSRNAGPALRQPIA